MAEIKPYSPDNPAHTRSRKHQAERDALREKDAFGWVMSDPRGRLAMGAIIIGAGVYDNPYGGNSTEFNCGRQYEGQKLVNLLEAEFPVEMLKLETERLRGKIEAKLKDEAARAAPAQQSNGQLESENDNG